MIIFIAMAFAGGIFVSLSRQINGRLSLSNSPLIASFWNHIVGFVALTLLGLIIGDLLPPGAADAPWYAFIGGPIGVVFIASGSWLIPRIGAVNTALLVISGQMVSGVLMDFFSDQPPKIWATALGVMMILGGMALTQRRK
ncbi:DMT family transporter [Agrobacterium larrymoorei]|uniref:DMT family transporter n=1 Tax=Agrobacterium larrymoorei TaxID=160699 RepID=UPI00157412D3|nr:DMT family transporter [Agrobacterium larrymoorei]NTJ42760.1 DMT family transporter [Agrobacterium larrymoorei]